MKKALAIPALGILCLAAAAGGIAIAVGPKAALSVIGLGSNASSTDTPTQDTDHAATGGTDEQGNVADAGDAHANDTHGGAGPDEAEMPVLPFPEIIVNVTDVTAAGRKTSRFLKLNMLMVYDDTLEGAERLLGREVYLRDAFQDFLRQLYVSDIQGSRGLAMMKTELLRRARAVGHTEAPVEILISDMVVQ